MAHAAHEGHRHAAGGVAPAAPSERRPSRSEGEGAGHEGQAHGAHADHAAVFARRFWICLLLTIPVLLTSELLTHLLGVAPLAFPGVRWARLALTSALYVVGGGVFLRGAAAELRHRRPGMMTLVALAITTAYGYTVAVALGLLEGMALDAELATLVTIMLLGHWLEMRALGRAESALAALAKLLPDTAERVVGERTETVPVAALRVGDVVLVRPGGRVPADGVVEDGRSELDESLLTGESRPVPKAAGAEVVAGAINVGGGALRVRVTRVGEDTVLAGIARLVRQAQASRGRAQVLADRAAFALTLVAVVAAGATFAAWLSVRGFDSYTVERVVSTLVVACPHALGLAIPLVVAIATTRAARRGVLVRERAAFERARAVDVVVFDKTGTLTLGRRGLVDVATLPGLDAAAALALAAAAEQASEHALARAVVAAAHERGLRLPRAEDFQALPGRGVRARIDGRWVQVGGPRLLEQEGIALPEPLAAAARAWEERGQTVIVLLVDRAPVAAFALADVVRPESAEAVAALKAMGIRVLMLTGDAEAVARWVAAQVGIEEVLAGVLPERKHEAIRALRAQGHVVAMVGDGVNDAPALAAADVGIAIGAGTDVARASAAIVLVRDDPRDVAWLIELSRASYRKMVENLAWAVGYNVVALPLAAGVLAPWGVVLPPAVGALLMSLSTVAVALNAQRLRRARLERRPGGGGGAQPELRPAHDGGHG